MKILIRQFLGKNHSWAVIGWNLATCFINSGHDVHLYSTDGIKHLPDSLKKNLIGYNNEDKLEVIGRSPDREYDCQISYTAMKNFPFYLSNGTKNRFGIWCYEWSGKNVLPSGFAKYYKYTDKLLPPSNHAKQVFLDSGIPESAIQVMPHGVSDEFINGTSIYPLKTDKKFKVLCNIAQPHLRKNIKGTLEAWGKAFTKKDDVVLVFKISLNKEQAKSDKTVDYYALLKDFSKKYPNHADILTINEFIPDISSLYRACNAYLSLSFAESFLIPALEGLASKKIVIVGEVGGQVDFCSTNNSLLVSGSIIRADPTMMYWEPKPNATVFKPNENHAAEQLVYAYKHEEDLVNKFDIEFNRIRKEYTWSNVSRKILSLTE